MVTRGGQGFQNYPRIDGELLAREELFPKQNPPLSLTSIDTAIEAAFARCKKSKTGEEHRVPETPEELVALCINHLKERSDPILSPFFFSQMNVEDVFDMDAVAHEMQRQRMKIGVFYQFLMIELMRQAGSTGSSNIKHVFDGTREGDAVADIDTPSFQNGLRLYISVKKSEDTVGGQDVGGVIRRLEDIAKDEKNVTSPYLCVIAIATPPKGKIGTYSDGRKVRCTKDGRPYSPNCEYWSPGFIYPYITGLTPVDIYKRSVEKVKDALPFYTLKVRDEATKLLKDKFIQMGLSDDSGKIDLDRFFDFILH
jgi:hypothetical protein